jgi:hypothetical protein
MKAIIEKNNKEIIDKYMETDKDTYNMLKKNILDLKEMNHEKESIKRKA